MAISTLIVAAYLLVGVVIDSIANKLVLDRVAELVAEATQESTAKAEGITKSSTLLYIAGGMGFVVFWPIMVILAAIYASMSINVSFDFKLRRK